MNPSAKDEDFQTLRAKWDRRYRDADRDPLPAAVLAENLHLLPPDGRALDPACGLGAGAMLLALCCWRSSGWMS